MYQFNVMTSNLRLYPKVRIDKNGPLGLHGPGVPKRVDTVLREDKDVASFIQEVWMKITYAGLNIQELHHKRQEDVLIRVQVWFFCPIIWKNVNYKYSKDFREV